MAFVLLWILSLLFWFSTLVVVRVNLFLGVVYMETELGLGTLSKRSRLLQKVEPNSARRLMVYAFKVWEMTTCSNLVSGWEGNYNNGNYKMHTDNKCLCTINIYIMDQENK